MTMSRELDLRESSRDERSSPQLSAAPAANDRADRLPERVPDAVDRLRPDHDRNGAVSVRAAQAVADIGAFRAVRCDDLARYRYDGDQSSAARDLRRLGRLGLVNRHRLTVSGGQTIDVAVLTEAGRSWAERQPSAPGE